jgi:hypothetical protein
MACGLPFHHSKSSLVLRHLTVIFLLLHDYTATSLCHSGIGCTTVYLYNLHSILRISSSSMTRVHEPAGSSNPIHPSLPVRSAVVAPAPSANENNNNCVRNAVAAGKSISGFLADTLKQSALASNDESNLHLVVTLAEELRNYQSPVEFTIGLIGDSGAGKSSLINSLLNTKDLAKTVSETYTGGFTWTSSNITSLVQAKLAPKLYPNTARSG